MEEYRCAAVFTSKNVLLSYGGTYYKAQVSNGINDQILVGDYLLCEKIYDQLYVKKLLREKT